MPLDVNVVIQQIDEVLAEFEEVRKRAQYNDYSDMPASETSRVASRLSSSIERLAPPGSYFRRDHEEVNVKWRAALPCQKINHLVGILTALRREYELGHFRSFAELIHADTAVSYIEMAEDLHAQGYKDAGAVIAGSVLEQHLRDLCTKNDIAILLANGKNKKADALNADLAAKLVYSKLDQKNVTSWLGLRNDAAHGNYTAYTAQQVTFMIQSVQDFMVRHPA